MKQEIKNRIVVFGGDHHNTLGVVRSLGEKGINSFVLLISDPNAKSLVLRSKYVTQGNVFLSGYECVQYLKASFTDKKNKTIVISTSDLATSFLDEQYDSLKNDFVIPNGKTSGNLTYLMNKEVMNNLARKVGFHVETSWYLSDISIFDKISYPCITKPLKSIAGSKYDINIYYNSETLREFAAKVECNNPIQVQRYIDKEFEYQLIGCSLNGGEEVVIPGYTRIIRAANNTNTGLLQYLPIEDFEFDKDICINFIRNCNYSGLFSLEFIRAKDCKDYFLEINFRNDGNAYAVTAAGVNLPYIWVLSSLGYDYTEEKNKPIKSILVMPELIDVAQVFHGKVSVLEWLKDLRSADCFIYYNKKDKKPFFYQLGYMIKTVLFKIFNEK